MLRDVAEEFSKIYKNNIWKQGSGVGSSPEVTVEYRKTLINLIKEKNIKTVIDYGCGDWQFSRFIPWESLVDQYTGVDVVDFLINDLNKTFSTKTIGFQLRNSNWSFTDSDLIICKDVLQHVPNNMVKQLLNEMKEHSKYILLTNDVRGPKDDIACNTDCTIGDWRPLDFSLAPWNLDIEKLFQWADPDGAIKDTVLLVGNLR